MCACVRACAVEYLSVQHLLVLWRALWLLMRLQFRLAWLVLVHGAIGNLALLAGHPYRLFHAVRIRISVIRMRLHKVRKELQNVDAEVRGGQQAGNADDEAADDERLNEHVSEAMCKYALGYDAGSLRRELWEHVLCQALLALDPWLLPALRPLYWALPGWALGGARGLLVANWAYSGRGLQHHMASDGTDAFLKVRFDPNPQHFTCPCMHACMDTFHGGQGAGCVRPGPPTTSLGACMQSIFRSLQCKLRRPWHAPHALPPCGVSIRRPSCWSTATA